MLLRVATAMSRSPSVAAFNKESRSKPRPSPAIISLAHAAAWCGRHSRAPTVHGKAAVLKRGGRKVPPGALSLRKNGHAPAGEPRSTVMPSEAVRRTTFLSSSHGIALCPCKRIAASSRRRTSRTGVAHDARAFSKSHSSCGMVKATAASPGTSTSSSKRLVVTSATVTPGANKTMLLAPPLAALEVISSTAARSSAAETSTDESSSLSFSLSSSRMHAFDD
mmetsp:Transcript_11486/g.25953  ORF Transcript_11486/g.25953 Transcript_11486/m.25953 type:complete len:222 (-) Transcript_11486:867-1532(-)